MVYFQRIGLLSSLDAEEVKQSIQKLELFLQSQRYTALKERVKKMTAEAVILAGRSIT